VSDPDRRAQAGILRPDAAQRRIELTHLAPAEPLARWVDYLWVVRWSAPPEGHVQEVVPRPAVQVVAERVDGVPRLRVHGVMTTRFARRLDGDDRAVAAAFAPAGFHPFLRSSVSALRDRAIDLSDLTTTYPDDGPLAAALLDPAVPAEEAGAMLTARLLALDPEPDPLIDELAALVARAEADRTVTRADQLADLAGVSLRTLQRRFVEHVGIGPKWVVQRCRLLDVAAAAHGGDVDWAALAHDLGYADQSHLVRGFTRLVGTPPATYAARSDPC
jgi:AraC-like DNA-binding protein